MTRRERCNTGQLCPCISTHLGTNRSSTDYHQHWSWWGNEVLGMIQSIASGHQETHIGHMKSRGTRFWWNSSGPCNDSLAQDCRTIRNGTLLCCTSSNWDRWTWFQNQGSLLYIFRSHPCSGYSSSCLRLLPWNRQLLIALVPMLFPAQCVLCRHILQSTYSHHLYRGRGRTIGLQSALRRTLHRRLARTCFGLFSVFLETSLECHQHLMSGSNWSLAWRSRNCSRTLHGQIDSSRQSTISPWLHSRRNDFLLHIPGKIYIYHGRNMNNLSTYNYTDETL